jgi:hypothetical protein
MRVDQTRETVIIGGAVLMCIVIICACVYVGNYVNGLKKRHYDRSISESAGYKIMQGQFQTLSAAEVVIPTRR